MHLGKNVRSFNEAFIFGIVNDFDSIRNELLIVYKQNHTKSLFMFGCMLKLPISRSQVEI